MSNIAILGCGYIGRQLGVELKVKGHKVRGSTTSENKLPEFSALVDEVQLLYAFDPLSLGKFLEDQEILVISVSPKSCATYELTYRSTIKTFLSIIDLYPKLKQVIYLSSTAVYGDRKGELVKEKDIDNRYIDIADHKVLLDCEALLLRVLSDKLTIFRLGAIYGKNRGINYMFNIFEDDKFPTTGNHYINFSHAEDIVGGILFSIDRSLIGVYNLVIDSNLTFRQQSEILAAEGIIEPINWSKTDQIKLKSVKVSNQKIKDVGFTFSHPYFNS